MMRAREIAGEEARRPFDLGRGPLLRARLLRLGDEDHVLLVTMHHIVSDGWSTSILARELSLFYAGYQSGSPVSLPELGVQYGDFAVWQRKWLQGEVLERQMNYWRGQLEGIAPLELPTDYPRPALQSFRGAMYRFAFPKSLSDRLHQLANCEHTSFFTTEPAEQLADVLAAHAPEGMGHIFFVSGGSEAMEAAATICAKLALVTTVPPGLATYTEPRAFRRSFDKRMFVFSVSHQMASSAP